MKINVFKDISNVKIDAWKGLSLKEIGWSILFAMILLPLALISLFYFKSVDLGIFLGVIIILPIALIVFFNVYNMTFGEFIRKFIRLRRDRAIIYYMPMESEFISEAVKGEESSEKQKKKYRSIFRKR